MKKAQLIVAGIGPGSPEDITPAVIQAVKNSDVVIGYKYYFQFIEPYLEPGTECIDTGMKREKARAEQAFELAEQGKTVCVISSGEPGPMPATINWAFFIFYYIIIPFRNLI